MKLAEYACDPCGTDTPNGAGIYLGDQRVCKECAHDMPWSWGDLANLTHETQVAVFGWCGCEDGPTVYEDCPQPCR